MFRRCAMTLFICGAGALSVAVFAQDATQTDAGMKSSGMSKASSMSRDKMFVKTAAEGGMAMVKLGQLAADKASSPDVKAFAQKIVDDHTKFNNDMKPIADRMGVMAPTILNAKDQALYDRLNGMSGTAFDKAYLKAMVMGHHKDVREFTAEKNSTKDPELKTTVTQGLDVIQQHTTIVEQLARSSGSMTGMKHSGSGSCKPM